jgi:hypothetical protein
MPYLLVTNVPVPSLTTLPTASCLFLLTSNVLLFIHDLNESRWDVDLLEVVHRSTDIPIGATDSGHPLR